MKTEINITFQTITHLWTGDAWGECNEIKPSAIIGGFRSYFKNYCKDNNITLAKYDKNIMSPEKKTK